MVSIITVACTNNNDDNLSTDVPVTAGSADFSKYVALGNSLTSGYTDGALFKAGQMNAYPKLLADQFSLVGGGVFNTPFVNDNTGGLLFGGSVNSEFGPRLVFNGVGPSPLPKTPTTEVFNILTGPFNNMGVPGAKSFHLLAPNYGDPAGLITKTANPYFVRFASSATTSIIADAMAQNPTFFSLWIGNNDVLGYATSGGDGSNPITPTTGAPGVGFDGSYTALINTLTSKGAKGVIANIPYVNTIPYFNFISVNPVSPSSYYVDGDESKTTPSISAGDLATINSINASLIGPMKQILTVLGEGNRLQLLSTTSKNPLLIVDESLTDLSSQITFVAQNSGNPQLVALSSYLGATFGKVRQTKNGDYILLPTSSVIGTAATLPDGVPSDLGKYGITYPLQDKHVLIPTEITEIRTATDSYNATIKSLAQTKGLAFVDANDVMFKLSNGGIFFDNFHFTSTYIRGGAFGTDGVHLTPRANAYIANKFLEAINKTYGATFKMYKPQDYAISYPASL